MPKTNLITYSDINYCREYHVQNQEAGKSKTNSVFEVRYTELNSLFVKWG